jgi:hypothetical protein
MHACAVSDSIFLVLFHLFQAHVQFLEKAPSDVLRNAVKLLRVCILNTCELQTCAENIIQRIKDNR